MGERELQVGRVQRFCLRDGPGIRTILFLQGCPLGCWWCQNPDLQAPGQGAGRSIRVDELSGQLLRDRRYWRSSGGGVTVSGGEPLVQAEGLAELLHLLAAQGVDRCVESSLGVDGGALAALLPQVDRWLVDLKHADAEVLHRVVGIDLGVYRSNLQRVLDACGAVQLRIALIRGFNDAPGDLSSLGQFLADLPAAVPVRILPGHDLGRLDKPQAAVTPEACRQACDILSQSAADVEVLW